MFFLSGAVLWTHTAPEVSATQPPTFGLCYKEYPLAYQRNETFSSRHTKDRKSLVLMLFTNHIATSSLGINSTLLSVFPLCWGLLEALHSLKSAEPLLSQLALAKLLAYALGFDFLIILFFNNKMTDRDSAPCWEKTAHNFASSLISEKSSLMRKI